MREWRYSVRYLFIGKLAAIFLGFIDITHDADLFVDRNPKNCRALIAALTKLEFDLTSEQTIDIERATDIVTIRNGPVEVDLVFAPRGLGDFEGSKSRKG